MKLRNWSQTEDKQSIYQATVKICFRRCEQKIFVFWTEQVIWRRHEAWSASPLPFIPPHGYFRLLFICPSVLLSWTWYLPKLYQNSSFCSFEVWAKIWIQPRDTCVLSVCVGRSAVSTCGVSHRAVISSRLHSQGVKMEETQSSTVLFRFWNKSNIIQTKKKKWRAHTT